MTNQVIGLIRRLDLPMFRAAAAGRMRTARALAVIQDLMELVILRPQGKEIATVRPVAGLR